MRHFRVAMVQMNPTVGDLEGNVRRITTWLREARKAKADLAVFPELAITGYPPEDLLLKPRFLEDNRRALEEIVRACRDLAAVVGYVGQGGGSPPKSAHPMVVPAGRHELYNAAAVPMRSSTCRTMGSSMKADTFTQADAFPLWCSTAPRSA